VLESVAKQRGKDWLVLELNNKSRVGKERNTKPGIAAKVACQFKKKRRLIIKELILSNKGLAWRGRLAGVTNCRPLWTRLA